MYKNIKIYSWEEIYLSIPTILSIGNFDGVHQGHQFLFKELEIKGKELNLKPIILTFNPHPRIFFQKSMRQIDSIGQRVTLIQNYVNIEVIVIQFDSKFSQLEPEEFIEEFLKKRLQTKVLLQGEEHFFGKNRQGNDALLRQKLATQSIPDPVIRFNNICLEHSKKTAISSSSIRKSLEEGQIESANDQLGRAFSFTGTVIHGEKIGQKLGFPTANIKTSTHQLIPKQGVYGGKVLINEISYFCVVNIGVKPTFSKYQETIEVHILDFNQKIYGKEVFLKLYCSIRGEIKFSSIQDLSKQIQHDIDYLKNKIKKDTSRLWQV